MTNTLSKLSTSKLNDRKNAGIKQIRIATKERINGLTCMDGLNCIYCWWCNEIEQAEC